MDLKIDVPVSKVNRSDDCEEPLTETDSPLDSRVSQTQRSFAGIDVKDDSTDSSDSEDEMDIADLQPESITIRPNFKSAKSHKLAVRERGEKGSAFGESILGKRRQRGEWCWTDDSQNGHEAFKRVHTSKLIVDDEKTDELDFFDEAAMTDDEILALMRSQAADEDLSLVRTNAVCYMSIGNKSLYI